MSLDIYYESSNDVYTSLGSNAYRFGEVALAAAASVGEASISQLVVDDPDGTRSFVGYRAVSAYETAAPSNNQLIWWGRIGRKTVTRGPSMRTGAARRWTIDLIEENVALSFRLLTDASANRPRETAGDRIRWLVNQSNSLSSTYAHPTYFANPTTQMDANDYRTQSNLDVLADIANATGYNFWLQWDQGRARREIIFLDPNGTDYASTIRISNDLADVDSVTTFAPSEDAQLERDPSRVTSGALVAYDGGWVYRRNAATVAQFAIIDRSAPVGTIKTAASAAALATRYLNDNDEEDDVIACSIIVPKASVNALRHGHLVLAKFTHLPGYTSYTYFRVLRRTVSQEPELGQDYYRISVELSPSTASPVLETVTLVATNTVLEDSTRNALASQGGITFAAGQVWRWTISNTQHHGDAYTDALALVWKTTSPPSAYTVVRAWGVSVYYAGVVGTPTATPSQGSYPAFTALSDTGTFTVTGTGTGEFVLYAGANYPGSATIDEQWTCVLERLS